MALCRVASGEAKQLRLIDRVHDSRVRTAAFGWLQSQVRLHGDVLPWALLIAGFEYEGRRVPLLSQQGIFKPAVLDVPLSIRTSPDGPYHDAFRRDGLLEYSYRGTDLGHRDNRGLRVAMAERLPLVYFHRMVPGRYLATWPVFIGGDDPNRLVFSVAVDDATKVEQSPASEWVGGESADIRREYVTSLARRRLHQRAFRERVLAAYRHQCALCRLKHEELLDAAHIVPDADPEGEPVVSNGLALCRLHHTAFDRFFIGVRPDYVIEVRRDLLEEEDGPTLKHAIQGLHGHRISVPRREELKPAADLLLQRYELFRETNSPEDAV
jgi:putative restriction endonuclease